MREGSPGRRPLERRRSHDLRSQHRQLARDFRSLLQAWHPQRESKMNIRQSHELTAVHFGRAISSNALIVRISFLQASVHPAYTKQEFFNALEKVKPKAIFIPEEFKTLKFYENLCKWIPELASSAPGQLNSAQFPSIKTIIVEAEKSLPGTVNMKEILQGSQANLEEAEAKVGCDDPLTVIFTSVRFSSAQEFLS